MGVSRIIKQYNEFYAEKYKEIEAKRKIKFNREEAIHLFHHENIIKNQNYDQLHTLRNKNGCGTKGKTIEKYNVSASLSNLINPVLERDVLPTKNCIQHHEKNGDKVQDDIRPESIIDMNRRTEIMDLPIDDRKLSVPIINNMVHSTKIMGEYIEKSQRDESKSNAVNKPMSSIKLTKPQRTQVNNMKGRLAPDFDSLDELEGDVHQVLKFPTLPKPHKHR